MKLFFRKYGEGQPLIILHGLFGMSDNWNTLAKQFSTNGFTCYLVDQRNHGRSPHSAEFKYEVMADDLLELMDGENLTSASFIGHSMGGKTAMFFAVNHSGKTEKLVVADMAPRYYPPHHDNVFAALHSIDLDSISSRKEVEEQLRLALHDEATVQFLLKNLYWKEGTRGERRGARGDETGLPAEGQFGPKAGKRGNGEAEKKLAWRFNLPAIEKNIEAIGVALPGDAKFNKPTLFVRGEKSGYITVEDELLIKKHFPRAQVKMIPKAGHWVHAENPAGFMEAVLEFLKN